jgi:glycerate-2-kinase
VSHRALLADLHRAALDEVHAGRALARELAARDPGAGPFVLLASGKAACAMAEAARAVLGARIARGAVTTKDGHARALPGLDVREASHPLPDARSERAGREALALAGSLAAHEELLVLISGGASALWCVPAAGLAFADKRDANERLLRASIAIRELNAVRKHLSALKGGGLLRAAAGRRVRVYAVSDVPGDALADIGSGPASPDPTRFGDALAALRASGLEHALSPAVCERLERGAAGELEETVKPDDPLAARCTGRVVASLDAALGAIVRAAESRGLRVRSLGRALDADVVPLANALAAQVRRARADGIELLVAGGEPTVTVRGDGRGGRAQELAVRLALALADLLGWTALCAGTDGSDGPTDAAGAFADPTLAARARSRGSDPALALARSDVHPLLAASGDLFRTGPTETNVSDLLLVRVQPPGAHGTMR